jgi:hypothetical protein
MENLPKAQPWPLDSVQRHRRWDLPVASPQAALDRITLLAGEALGVAAVCASLVDAEGQLLTSSYGMPVSTALLVSHAFRKHVVGMPLHGADGRAVGTLMAMDRKPRRWTNPQLELMGTLSTMIVREMELVGVVRRASRSDVSSVSVPAK